ncbi:radical SAM/SPASM domain-containing protein [Dactylosporangium darangshiense]|uniref:Radical SAM core domain-containing protein n=1 Tax=Dactylosporangium darangshiense TaxID=579108 RepID=A0ABP8DU67_9ACTN
MVEQLVETHADAGHVRFGDGVVFHVRSGEVDQDATECKCGQPEPIFQITRYREPVPQLQLSLTDVCNMGCTYCSFRDRVHADGKPVTMPLETARRAIDFYGRQVVGAGAGYGRIDFGLAGETMLVRHLHDQVQRLIEDGLAASDVAIVWSGPNVTNATLSMSDKLAATLGAPQDISIDGPRDVHDRVRFYTNDRGGTYDDVRSVLDQVLQRHPGMGVSAVLTAYCTDFARIFSHLFDEIGARNIYMKPVNARHDVDYALNAETLPVFQEGYRALVEHILAHPPQGILDRLLALSPEDYFMRFVYRVKDRTVQTYRCGAGKSGAYVDTNGNLYACAHFIGKSGWHIGHVDTGFDEEKRRHFTEMTVDTRPACQGCYARYVCGGGCHYQAVLANNDISRPDEVKCELIRFLTRLAVRLVATLQQMHPQVLAALPTPYGIDPGLATAPAETAYRPTGRLCVSDTLDIPAPIALDHAGRVRGALRPEASLGLTSRMHDGRLTLYVDSAALDIVEAVRVWLQPYGESGLTLGDLPVRGPSNSGRLLRLTRHGAEWLDTPGDRFRRVPHPEESWISAPDVALEFGPASIRATIDVRALVDAEAPVGVEAPTVGVNVLVDLRSGGTLLLARYEPFVDLPVNAEGFLELAGPEADALAGGDAGWPDGLLPLGRWTGLQPNVC